MSQALSSIFFIAREQASTEAMPGLDMVLRVSGQRVLMRLSETSSIARLYMKAEIHILIQ